MIYPILWHKRPKRDFVDWLITVGRGQQKAELADWYIDMRLHQLRFAEEAKLETTCADPMWIKADNIIKEIEEEIFGLTDQGIQ